ncbi:MAG: PhzF family phenazine biosynthesis protein [Novosphingobium sp.]
MTAIPYWHVDAFAARPFAGNQAAVMILDDWLDDATLAAIGAENLFAETAFVVRNEPAPGAADWSLRWFTPACEVRLCGHATLAAGHVLLAREPELDAVTFSTARAGTLTVRRAPDGYELALPAIPVEPGAWPEAVAALGGPAPQGVWRSPDRYEVFLYTSAAEIAAVAPDVRALAALGDHQFICTAPGDERADVVSRVFVPGAGIDEDSATGSAHAVLTPFWADRFGRPAFRAFQASRRGAHFSCRLDGSQAWLGGRCIPVVEGTFHLWGDVSAL